MSDKLLRLTAIGFARAGAWRLTGSGIASDITDEFVNLQNVLYAFVVDGDLAYVGKTTTPLRARLQGYKSPAKSAERGGSTNIKNNRNIREALATGKSFDVYVLHEALPQVHGGFVVNFAASLEDSLVADLSPPWNGRQQVVLKAIAVSALVIASSPTVAFISSVVPPSVSVSQHTARVTATDFRSVLARVLTEATGGLADHVDVRAGQLHTRVGGYPGKKHVMPVCCSVMRAAMRIGDMTIAQPPKGNGASLTIRYRLPR